MIRAKLEFSITDSEILEAIRVHTTGKVGMSKLDKVIFLADYIEPNRDFPGVDELRNVAKKDLIRLYCLVLTILLTTLLSNIFQFIL